MEAAIALGALMAGHLLGGGLRFFKDALDGGAGTDVCVGGDGRDTHWM